MKMHKNVIKTEYNYLTDFHEKCPPDKRKSMA